MVLLIILLGGGYGVYRFYLTPLHERERSIKSVEDEMDKTQETIDAVLAKKPKLERWRQLSLPADPDKASREYGEYLADLGRNAGFATGSFTPVPKPPEVKTSPALPGKGPVYTKYTFVITAHGTLENLVQVLEQFYSTSLLQQIKTLMISRPLTSGTQQNPRDLDITMTVEALNVAGSGNRSKLLPNVEPGLLFLNSLADLCGAPSGLALAAWAATPAGPSGPKLLADPPRQYAAIANKNVFLGPEGANENPREEVEVTSFVHLTDITKNDRRWEAWLYDRFNNGKTRLRAESPFDWFRVLDDTGKSMVHGQVVRIDGTREVVFRANEKYYSLHIGESIEQAMKKALPTARLRELGLSSAGDKRSGSE